MALALGGVAMAAAAIVGKLIEIGREAKIQAEEVRIAMEIIRLSMGLSEDEHKNLNGCKVTVNYIVGDGTYFDVVVVDTGVKIFGLSEYHMGFK